MFSVPSQGINWNLSLQAMREDAPLVPQSRYVTRGYRRYSTITKSYRSFYRYATRTNRWSLRAGLIKTTCFSTGTRERAFVSGRHLRYWQMVMRTMYRTKSRHLALSFPFCFALVFLAQSTFMYACATKQAPRSPERGVDQSDQSKTATTYEARNIGDGGTPHSVSSAGVHFYPVVFNTVSTINFWFLGSTVLLGDLLGSLAILEKDGFVFDDTLTNGLVDCPKSRVSFFGNWPTSVWMVGDSLSRNHGRSKYGKIFHWSGSVWDYERKHNMTSMVIHSWQDRHLAIEHKYFGKNPRWRIRFMGEKKSKMFPRPSRSKHKGCFYNIYLPEYSKAFDTGEVLVIGRQCKKNVVPGVFRYAMELFKPNSTSGHYTELPSDLAQLRWLEANSPDSILAIGSDDNDDLKTFRYDGENWVDASSILPTGIEEVRRYHTISERDIWLVSSDAREGGTIWHYDGQRWLKLKTGLPEGNVISLDVEKSGVAWLLISKANIQSTQQALLNGGSSWGVPDYFLQKSAPDSSTELWRGSVKEGFFRVVLPEHAGEALFLKVRGVGDVWIKTEKGVYWSKEPDALLEWRLSECNLEQVDLTSACYDCHEVSGADSLRCPPRAPEKAIAFHLDNYKMSSNANYFFCISELQEKLGDWQGAIESIQRYLMEKGDMATNDRRLRCYRKLEWLKKQLIHHK